MDKAILEYQKRRQARMDKKYGVKRESNFDSIEEFRERRFERNLARMDANPRIAYGIAKGMGIDTTGMSPKEVYEAIKKGGGNAHGKRAHGSKEYEISKAGKKSAYTRGFDDVVRFTVLSDHKGTVKTVNDTIKKLGKMGYECVELDNKWLPQEDKKTGKMKPSEYKAVHLAFKSPTGETFEVQVHSDESMKVKNMNHALYEEQRNPKTSEDRAKELGSVMAKNVSGLSEPDGIMDLQSFKKERK